MRPVLAAVPAVAAGGALGAALRWTAGELVPAAAGFPWTTLLINVSGSAALAALPAVPAVRRRPVLAVFCGTGVIGGFTTLSAYAEETRTLLAAGRTVTALAYLLGTLAACLVAVVLAHALSGKDAQREFEDEEGNE